MSFDPLTLWSVLLMVGLMLSAAMVLVWLLMPDEPALVYWAAFPALLAAGIAGAMARGLIPDFVSVGLANAGILLGYGLIWTGLRVFDHRRPRLGLLPIAPVLWILLCQLPLFRDHIGNRIILLSVLTAAMSLLCVVQLWRGWRAPSRVRGVAVALFLASTAIALMRIPFAGALVDGDRLLIFVSPRFVWIGLLAILVLILTAFVLVLMLRERVEQTYRAAADRDALTGLLNRRAFIRVAGPLCRKGGPVALLLLDLDRFKQINDRFGHAAGDRVLMQFAQVLRLDAGGGDVVARIGGEEFVALLPGARPNSARQLAERIQNSFRDELEKGGSGASMGCSVSIGLALGELAPLGSLEEGEAVLSALMARADAALYDAKFKGRNRIETVWFGLGDLTGRPETAA